MRSSNPRAIRSRQKLGDALVSLILERGWDKLTVTAIRKRAGVGHATFYRHYKSPDELLADALKTTILELAEVIREQDTIYEETVAMFRFIEDNEDRFLVLVGLPETHPIRGVLKDVAVNVVVEHWEARGASPVPLDVSVNHLVESSYAFIRWRLNHINDHTPEQVAEYFYDLIIAGAETKALSLRTDKHRHPPGRHED